MKKVIALTNILFGIIFCSLSLIILFTVLPRMESLVSQFGGTRSFLIERGLLVGLLCYGGFSVFCGWKMFQGKSLTFYKVLPLISLVGIVIYFFIILSASSPISVLTSQ